MAITPVKDYAAPPQLPNRNGDGFGGIPAYDPLPPRYYVVEQIKNSVTGQIWFVGRSTLNVNDGFIPTNDFSLNTAIKKNGKAKMIKTQVGILANATAVTDKLADINSGIVNIRKVTGNGGTVPLPSIIFSGLSGIK